MSGGGAAAVDGGGADKSSAGPERGGTWGEPVFSNSCSGTGFLWGCCSTGAVLALAGTVDVE